jgi:hypothetical protein
MASSILPPPDYPPPSPQDFKIAFTPIQCRIKCTIQSTSPICLHIFVICLHHQPTVTNTLQQQQQMLHSLCSHAQHLKFASKPASMEGGTMVAIAAKMVSPMMGVLSLSFILPWVDCFASLVLSLGNGRADLSRCIVACGYFWLIVTFRLVTSPHAFFPSL